MTTAATTSPVPPTVPNLRLVAEGKRPGRGGGSMRERRPGVWEIRICVGRDPVTHRTQQRSVTVRGDRVAADRVRAELVCAAAMSLHASPTLPSARLIRVGELMAAWVVAEHEWRPSTVAGNRSIVRTLATDPLLAGRVGDLTSSGMRSVVARWEMAGASVATRSARVRALRSALTWGYDERLVDTHPLRFFRGPGRCPPRRPLSDNDVRRLLTTAAQARDEAAAGDDGQDRRQVMIRHRAEQNLLLVRLAADTGARRGELAALHRDDLEGRVLRIERALSGRHLLTPKSGHSRWLTVGAHTAELWHDLTQSWRRREGDELGPWLFSSDLAHQHHLGAEVLGQLLAAHKLNDRVGAALFDALLGLRITRPSYVKLTELDERTATRDLVAAADRGLLEARGERRGRYYVAGQPLRSIQEQVQKERRPLEDPYPSLLGEIRRARP